MDGRFYGLGGGVGDNGVNFSVEPDPQTSYQILYTFSGPDGQYPNSLIQGDDGNFYGTTEARGPVTVGPFSS